MHTAPDHDEILERLRRVVPEKVDVAPELLQPDAQLVDIGIDSFSLIELVFVAEEEFRVKIPFEGLKVKTVGDVIEVIERRIRESAI